MKGDMTAPSTHSARLRCASLIALLVVVTPSTSAAETPHEATEDTRGDATTPVADDATHASLFGGEVIRDGLHLQATVGWAEGSDSQGLFHAMELGYTLQSGWTVTYLYTLLQNRGFGATRTGPARLEGHLLGLKVPLYYPELVAKVAVGAESVHALANGDSDLGIGWLYGVDLHFPVHARSGFTVSLTAHQVTLKGYQHCDVALAGGYTCF